jgi:hypothetical protein
MSFVQKLGRGLRTAPGKDHLVISTTPAITCGSAWSTTRSCSRERLGGEEDPVPYAASPEPTGLRLGAVESGMAVSDSEAVRWLPSGSTSAESRSGRIGPIILEAKQTGERSAGNPHAAFDEAGAGNVARPRWCDTRRRKSEPTGNTNFGLTPPRHTPTLTISYVA